MWEWAEAELFRLEGLPLEHLFSEECMKKGRVEGRDDVAAHT